MKNKDLKDGDVVYVSGERNSRSYTVKITIISTDYFKKNGNISIMYNGQIAILNGDTITRSKGVRFTTLLRHCYIIDTMGLKNN